MKNVQLKGPAGLVMVPESEVESYIKKGFSVPVKRFESRKNTEIIHAAKPEEMPVHGICMADIKKMSNGELEDVIENELLNVSLDAYRTIGAKRNAVIEALGLNLENE